jgi:hypothetical protein
MEGLLAEAQAEIARLNSELSTKSKSFEQEKKDFDAKLEAEVVKSSNLQKSLKELQDKCLNFGYRCVQRLKQVFNSVGASSEKFKPSAEDLPGIFDHIGNRFITQIWAKGGRSLAGDEARSHLKLVITLCLLLYLLLEICAFLILLCYVQDDEAEDQ